ncbi:DUF2076 domain-containing protein [Azohydromonas aeria]|uniref:DUF2076 domain-containing protein n=1 Tax=Azohydromonas aeria TaxID=2590212 RepID=UPI0012FCA4E9|nr:DUF2076 family protein [Azohydromonas aeria]
MNADEKLRVARLVTRLARQAETPQDEEAALELAALLKVRPDAPYLLMQRALMLELALERAQAELAQLRGEAPGQQPSGHGQAPGAGQLQPFSGGTARAPLRPAGGWQPGMGAFAGQGQGPAWGAGTPMGAAPSAGGGFLRNAAAVGAGVLGGSLLFHGLDSLFHDHGDVIHGAGQGLLSGDMQAPLDALSGNDFIDPANDPSGGDLLGGDMLGDGGFDGGGDEDWT